MGPGLALIVAVLAVLSPGVAYLRLGPFYPPDRIACLLVQSRARLVLSQGWLKEALPVTGLPVIDLGGPWQSGQTSASLPTPVYESLSCIIYTSGSTGEPKGVLLTNAGLV